MKTYKVIFKHGHFIDVDSQLRIIPIQGQEYVISGDSNSFKEEDPKMMIGDPLNSNDKLEWATKHFKDSPFKKILNAGDKLFFRIGNSRREDGDESTQYIFLCTLLEDLYLYLQKNKKGDEIEHWRLADCKCVLESCLLGGLTLTEKIPAYSLNSLFNFTVQFYFSMQRSASTSTFSTFCLFDPFININFDGAIYSRYRNLSHLRKEFVQNYNSRHLISNNPQGPMQ
jgi:hypothetical protein